MHNIGIDLRMLSSSGIGTYLQNIVPRIIELNCNWNFILLGSSDEISKYQWSNQPNVQIVDCKAPIYSIEEQFVLPSSIPRFTELFWSPHYNIPVFYTGKILVTIHDVLHLAHPEFFKGFHKKLYSKFMFRAVRRKAEAILFVSEFTKSQFIQFVGNPHKVLEVTHLGVASEWFEVKRRHNPHVKPYVLYVGNVKPHKNLIGLLKGFQKIADKIPHDVVIVGKKDGFITQDQEVFDVGQQLGGRVKFTGEISQKLLQQYYVFADALVLPSLYEGFGLPPLEAMACGCPVLVSDKASLPEVCGDAALYVNPCDYQDIADKIVMLLTNSELQNTLRKKGLKRASSFSWDDTALKTSLIMKKIIV